MRGAKLWVLAFLVLGACSSNDDGPANGSSSGTTSSGGSPSGASSSGSASSSGGSSSSGMSSGTSSGGAGDGGNPSPLSGLSDDFTAPTLSSAWSVLHPELVQLSIVSGALRAAAPVQSLWYEASQGPFVHRAVTGDFKATSRVRARSAASPASPPLQNIHLGGIMARSPAAGSENYVFIVVGNDVNDVSVETKSTLNGVSTFNGPSWPSGDADLRVCRIGATFRMFAREIGGGAWTESATFDRPDLPATLQVGALIYANTPSPDLAVTFDEITFAAASAPADCSM